VFVSVGISMLAGAAHWASETGVRLDIEIWKALAYQRD
jgi:hypothetical protein